MGVRCPVAKACLLFARVASLISQLNRVSQNETLAFISIYRPVSQATFIGLKCKWEFTGQPVIQPEESFPIPFPCSKSFYCRLKESGYK